MPLTHPVNYKGDLYTVELVDEDGRHFSDSIFIRTPGMAAHAMTIRHRGAKPIAVNSRLIVLGRCGKCCGILFEGEYTRSCNGELRCDACHR